MGYLTTDYQIASGHNNAGGLVLISTLSDGNHTFIEPTGIFKQNRGKKETRTNGIISRAGKPRINLISDMLYSQYVYLKENFEGFVTVRVAYLSTSFANYNAVLNLADPEEMTEVRFAAAFHEAGFEGPGFKDVPWILTKLDAI